VMLVEWSHDDPDAATNDSSVKPRQSDTVH